MDSSQRTSCLRAKLPHPEDAHRSVAGQARGRLLPLQRREISEAAQKAEVRKREHDGLERTSLVRVQTEGDRRVSAQQEDPENRRLVGIDEHWQRFEWNGSEEQKEER